MIPPLKMQKLGLRGREVHSTGWGSTSPGPCHLLPTTQLSPEAPY